MLKSISDRESKKTDLQLKAEVDQKKITTSMEVFSALLKTKTRLTTGDLQMTLPCPKFFVELMGNQAPAQQ